MCPLGGGRVSLYGWTERQTDVTMLTTALLTATGPSFTQLHNIALLSVLGFNRRLFRATAPDSCTSAPQNLTRQYPGVQCDTPSIFILIPTCSATAVRSVEYLSGTVRTPDTLALKYMLFSGIYRQYIELVETLDTPAAVQ